MAGLATNGEAAVITAITATPFIGLHTSDPGTGTTVTGEVSGGAYARKATGALGNAGNNPTVCSNSALIAFVTATASWGLVTGFSWNSAVTAGTFYGGGLLTTSKTINTGDTAQFAIGALTITVN